MNDMVMALLAVAAGLAVLVWSADKFVEGSAAVATHFSVPPLLIGMVIVGFGTSAPEMVVSSIAASQGNPGIALGNALGSNITNIALILGITALINPITVQSRILHKELPILTGVTLLAGILIYDESISRADAWVLLGVFAALLAWSIREGMKPGHDALGDETATELQAHAMPVARAWFWLGAGLLLLIASSRLLVWGAVSIAQSLGVSDLIIGLTVVAVGTSLPELAACVVAARKGEHDIALGNVLGSNLFNTLAVVGIAGMISPMTVEPAVFARDWAVMAALTVFLFVIGYGFRGQPGRINRWEASVLLAAFLAYTGWLVGTVTGQV